MWGIADTPADIEDEDWLPFVFEGDDANYADDAEGDKITGLLLALLEEQYERIGDEW